MKFLIVFAAVAACASAGLIASPYGYGSAIVRAPAHDSAVIKSDRLGGNFAYSTAENHAYAAVTPVVQHVATPVAVSYSAPAIAAAPIAYSAGLYGHGYGYGYAGYGHGLYGGAVIAA